jgi:methylmalonyl-CoA/ethylmalonyl-CoA epimerase
LGKPASTDAIRRLDHVAVVVANTEVALEHFRDRLSLRVVYTEDLESPHVRLTYLDAGNAYIQLLEPLDAHSEAATVLARDGEGLHHICFAVDDPVGVAQSLAENGARAVPGTGRGRVSAFVPGPLVHGLRIECTAFDHSMDVEQARGWLGETQRR